MGERFLATFLFIEKHRGNKSGKEEGYFYSSAKKEKGSQREELRWEGEKKKEFRIPV